jgi:peptidoglycan/xylan/chitin deacetylase (PgdA/CDA1 family)
MKKGTLVISLDFELVWGLFDHIEIKDTISYFNNTLEAIPQIISIFEKNSIQATWATVGMLFNENWEEWHSNIPDSIPTYNKVELNPYEYGKKHQKSGLDQLFFAPDLIKTIQSAKGQEIGTHTYSHYYCLEKGQTKAQFEADINQAMKMAQKFNIDLKSLVFPRNQFNEDYLEICAHKGIETVRTNPNFWYWNTTKKETFAVKLARTGDAYFPLGKKSYTSNSLTLDKVLCQQASRFLRPQHSLGVLNAARLNRINNEIIQAAKNGEVYHLWWHPHNFGVDVAGSIKTLQAIVETFKYCSDTYDMESLTMKELRDRCLGDLK